MDIMRQIENVYDSSDMANTGLTSICVTSAVRDTEVSSAATQDGEDMDDKENKKLKQSYILLNLKIDPAKERTLLDGTRPHALWLHNMQDFILSSSLIRRQGLRLEARLQTGTEIWKITKDCVYDLQWKEKSENEEKLCWMITVDASALA